METGLGREPNAFGSDDDAELSSEEISRSWRRWAVGSSPPMPRLSTELRDVLALGAIALMLLVTALNLWLLGGLIRDQADVRQQVLINRNSGLVSRSISCANLVTQIGVEALPDACTDPEILALYKPSSISKATAAVDDDSVRRTLCRTEMFKDDVSCR